MDKAGAQSLAELVSIAERLGILDASGDAAGNSTFSQEK
jgi:hypothetical protein